MKVALYARVSTHDQTCDNQLLELRRYAEARGWSTAEFIDNGVSGSKDRRPALDDLMLAAKRRKLDSVVVWSLDRMGRNLKHLVALLEELQALGVTFVSLREGIDFGTPAGKLQFHILAALSEFERARLQERVKAGLARAKAQGQRLGRRRTTPLPDGLPRGLTVRSAAVQWGVSKSTGGSVAGRWTCSRLGTNPSGRPSDFGLIQARLDRKPNAGH